MADSLKTLVCPACGEYMEKVFIPSSGINIDICTQGCGGIYFDNREFNDFDEKDEDISVILEKIENKEFKKVSENLTRVCPNCGSKMVKNYSSVRKTIQVDECYGCGAKFLDRDELIKIREEYDTEEERADDVVQELYKTVGCELAEVELRHSEISKHRTFVRSLFYKLTGL